MVEIGTAIKGYSTPCYFCGLPVLSLEPYPYEYALCTYHMSERIRSTIQSFRVYDLRMMEPTYGLFAIHYTKFS
mgnify:CR=1 FL=1